MTVAAL